MRLANIKIYGLLVAFLLLFTGKIIHGQEVEDNAVEVKLDKAYIKSYWCDTKKILSSPFHWDKKNWIIAGTVMAGIIILYTQDENIRGVFQRNLSDIAGNASKYVFEPMGSGLISIPLMGGFFIYGQIAKSPKAVRVSLNSAKAFILTGAFTLALKHLTHRHRPSQDDPANPYLWEGPVAPLKYEAFPSGHTSTAFAVATVFALEYKDKVWVPILAYTLASGAGLSRIYDDKHWASDVLFGAALGYGIGRLVHLSSLHKSNMTLIPVFNEHMNAGIYFRYGF